jgi:hypothetical protein
VLPETSDPRLHRAVRILGRPSAQPNAPRSDTDVDPDLALILGDYDLAARGYEKLILAGRNDGIQAWAGLVVARAAGVPDSAEQRPELLKALYSALSSTSAEGAPSPARLAAWLDAEGAG